jgi:3-oxoacyl-[acyl-carrier protein] reductase
MRFKNKVALITGGARDIGKAIAQRIAAEGGKVVINYFQSSSLAEQTLSEIKSEGGDAVIFKADVRRASEVKKLVEFVVATYGDRLDILVNNAGGIVDRKKLREQDEEFYDAVMDLNVKSVFLVTRSFVPMMTSGGAIVNVSSLAARDGGGGGASLYAASKGAITTYTRGLAKELGPEGIRVNAVCPGLIDTTFHDIFTPDDVRAKVASGTPLRREGTSGEVSNLVAFLASEEASFITGANYDINGGLGLF